MYQHVQAGVLPHIHARAHVHGVADSEGPSRAQRRRGRRGDLRCPAAVCPEPAEREILVQWEPRQNGGAYSARLTSETLNSPYLEGFMRPPLPIQRGLSARVDGWSLLVLCDVVLLSPRLFFECTGAEGPLAMHSGQPSWAGVQGASVCFSRERCHEQYVLLFVGYRCIAVPPPFSPHLPTVGMTGIGITTRRGGDSKQPLRFFFFLFWGLMSVVSSFFWCTSFSVTRCICLYAQHAELAEKR